MTLMDKVLDLIDAARNGLIYDFNAENLRLRLFKIYEDLAVLKEQIHAEGIVVPFQGRKDLALNLPAFEAYDAGSGRYFTAPMRTVFMIGDFVTESKILAIKEVRNLDGIKSLKEAKDYVDGLQAQGFKVGSLNAPQF